MFGLGGQEILFLLILGVVLVCIPVGVVFLVLFLLRRQGGSHVAELEAENLRLRERLDEKRDPAEPDRGA